MGCGRSSQVSRVDQGATGIVPAPPTKVDSNIVPKPPPLHEPENEPLSSVASQSGTSSNRGGAFNRTEKQSQRIRRQKGGDTITPGERADGKKHSIQPNEVSAENRRFLSKVLQKHFLFAGLEDDERSSIIDYMMLQKCAPSESIFAQGKKGDSCYIIQSGVFTVSIDDQPLKQLRSKHTFGELAMLYNVNRTATVACTQEGVLWKMDGNTFRLCMDKLSNRHMQRALGFLNSEPGFRNMAEAERKLLAGACSVQVFARGEQILREGEVGDWMFIVIEGSVQTVDRFGNQTVKKAGTMLGSAGMIYNKQQVSGAKAIDNVTCLALGKNALERLLGPVEDVLRRSAIKSLFLDSKSSELAFFKQLTDVQQNLVVDKFDEATFQKGEAVISKGARAQLIVVMEGEVAVMKESVSVDGHEGDIAWATQHAAEVLSPGMAYGGQALLDNSDMKGAVMAVSQARVHRIGYDMVKEALKHDVNEAIRLNEIKKVLGDIFLFKNLHEEQIDRVVRCLERREYTPGENIVQQGDEANNFYLIVNGTIKVRKDGQQLRSLGRWDYFGERGLLVGEKRSATCQAEEACVCLCLDKAVFADIVGIFRKELEHRMNLQDATVQMEDLRLKAVVGRGSFGIVKLVCHKHDEQRVYALKCVGKKQVVRQGQQKSICVEREVNAQCYHPCIMQFVKTFQDSKSVYFLTEFLGGGDLFYAIREIGSLTKAQSQFYGGSIALALEYLHARSILYRDLKPENVLLDFKGNAKLVDFGCCKKALRTNTLVGTPEYFAPETILGKGYTCAIDWWALGVMMHEFIVGPLPFGRETEDQLELFREILEAPLQFPVYVQDSAAVSVVSGLLERTPEMRLGASTRGAKEIKEHPYFADFDWNGLAGRYLKAPWTPNQRKLQSLWEIKDGEAVGEGEPMEGNVDQAMEWAKGF